jgi:hypothetical protein
VKYKFISPLNMRYANFPAAGTGTGGDIFDIAKAHAA